MEHHRDEDELRKMLRAFQAGFQAGINVQGTSASFAKRRGRPRGSKYLGDIDRTRVMALNAAMGLLLETGSDEVLEMTDPKLIEHIRKVFPVGVSSEVEMLIHDLICVPTIETVLVSVRKGRARIKCMKKS
ncbi:hypothetical protein BMI91_16920 [Thioclava sediminum]|uniref:Uncharacterized protein n=1 Tax=Thioclava sediminum TaxID=1915319 RepID=A0ABX3MTW1_9RHOB|nr:hypothetical protein [Thioclava sediminum]OOY23125.1 hypothetical protein BMI91_16920 [Thioclava sediminum]